MTALLECSMPSGNELVYHTVMALGTVHKLRRQAKGEEGSAKNLFLPTRGEGGVLKNLHRQVFKTCMYLTKNYPFKEGKDKMIRKY